MVESTHPNGARASESITQPTVENPIINRNPQPTISVSSMEFADEVRTDRLNLLWKIVMYVGLFFIWIAFMRRNTNGDTIALVSLVLTLGAFTTGRVLKRGRYELSAWIFSASVLVAVTIPMLTGNPDTIRIVPFIYPFIVFLVGLMLPPVHTFSMLVITGVLTFSVPWLATGDWDYLGPYPFVAGIIALVSALVSAQVTGELYQITGWALDNYSRERRTSLDLFDNRQRLEKSLKRSEVLGEKLQEINSELESAKHFRGQFLANMSHELRTPLNAIIGFSETMLSFPMMYDDVSLPETYRQDMEQIHISGQQLLTVINDILDLSKVDAGKLEISLGKVSLDNIIDNAMMTAAGLLSKKSIELKRDVPIPAPDVYADHARLQQVLLNLYSNAAKFTDEGSITLSVKPDENPRYIKISLADTGSGIKPDALESVFEEFTQAESDGRDPRAGAGLGLTISRKLLSLMDGRIYAESEYGKGSTFHVIVPKYDPQKHGGDDKVETTATRPKRPEGLTVEKVAQ
jgi:signal transduction histidine kinase